MNNNNMKGDLVLQDITTGKKFLLESGTSCYNCGRGKNSQIMSHSVLVSREHCVFMRTSKGLSIIDVGSANGIYINGRHQKAKMMIELEINDVIGLGCPDTTPYIHPEPGDGEDATNKVQMKTIYRLKLPESTDIEHAKPAMADPAAATSTDNKRRLSRDSSESRLPEKKLKTEDAASIPDVIDITDSDDEVPIVANGWSKPSGSSDPFAGANLSVIKYEPPSDSSISYEKDKSTGQANSREPSTTAGGPTCDSNIERKKSPDENKGHCRDTAINAKTDERSGVGIKKPTSSRDTNSKGENGRREKTKSFPVRVNHLGQLTRVVSEDLDSCLVSEELDSRVVSKKLDSPDVSEKLKSPVIAEKVDPPVDPKKVDPSIVAAGLESRVEHPDTATSLVDPSRSNERAAPARRASEDSSSGEEIDVLRRAGLLDLSPDESSHSSWENVEDFSIPGYNAEKIESNDATELPAEINNDASNCDFDQVDQEIKYEPELEIMDVDESIYTNMNNFSQSLTPIKVKRVVKQEPITEYSQYDVVALSDDDDDVFPASQLFGDEEDIADEPKVKVENEMSDDNDEIEKEIFDRRENDYPDLIVIPDSDDEDNPWYDRLIRAELNVSRESVIKKVQEGMETEVDASVFTGNKDALISSIEEEAPMSSIEENAPMSPVEDDAPMSPIEEYAPMSPIEEDAPGSSAENDARQSHVAEDAIEFPAEHYDRESRVAETAIESPAEDDAREFRVAEAARESPAEEDVRESHVVKSAPKSPTENAAQVSSEKTAPEDLLEEFFNEIEDLYFGDDKNKTGGSVADKKKQKDIKKRTKNHEKTKKPAEEHAHQKVPRSPRSSKDDSTSTKSESADIKATHKKRSHHAKQESSDKAAIPDDAEAKTSSHKSKKVKQNDEKQRHSGEAKVAAVVDSINDKRDSMEGSTNLRTGIPVRSIPNRNPVVLLTKLEHVRKSVPLVEAPFIGNGQRRGVSCNIKKIDRSTNNTDIHAASTSGAQHHGTKDHGTKDYVTKDNGSSSRTEHRLSAKERKELSYHQKVEEKKYLKEQRHRRMKNRWAEVLPLRKTQLCSTPMTRAERDERKLDRKEKLKVIADKKKEQAETNMLPAKRIAKAKAKVTERSRNDFLVTELVNRSAKEPANIERTSADNTDKACVKETANIERTSLDNRDKGFVKETANIERISLDNRDKGFVKETANIVRTSVGNRDKGFVKETANIDQTSVDNRDNGCDKDTANNELTSVNDRVKISEIKKTTEESLNFRKKETAKAEIPFVRWENFYKENNAVDSEVSSARFERGSTANSEAPPTDRTKSPKGKKTRAKSLDSGKENAKIDCRLNDYTGEMVTDEGANSKKISSPLVRSRLTLEQRRSTPIDNRNLDKSKIPTNPPRAATMQNGTAKVLEESKTVAGQQVNNNVLYEKESTIASRDPRMKAGKAGKLKSLLKKSGRSKENTPRVIKRVSFDDLNTKIQYFEINPGNTLRKCDFKDAPSTIKNQSRYNDNVGTTGPKLEEFLLKIFEWNPVWLKEQRHMRTPPPIVNEKKLTQMIPRYASYEAYYEVTEPLMALELWHGISKDYDNGEVIQKSSMKYSIVNYSVTRTIVPSTDLHVTTLMIEAVVNKKQLQAQAHPVFGDLIFFEYVSTIKAKEGGGFLRWKVFGYVTKMHQAQLTESTQFNRDLLNYVQDPHTLLTYTVMTKPLNPCEMQTNKVSRLGTISYLRSNIRMIQALQYLPNSPLLNMVLHPKIEDYQLPPATNLDSYPLATKDNLNAKQLEAVARVTEAVEQRLPKICLIKGPPGTGKSKVIVNLITQILYGRNNRKKSTRILVCAPSNAAIDEIVIRLLDIRRKFEKGNRFNMVRIGREHAMHPTVKEVSLTELARKNVKTTADSYMSPTFSAESIEEEKRSFEARKNSLELELACSRNLTTTRYNHLQRKLADVKAKYDLLMNRRSAEHLDPKESAKLHRASENTLLAGADVIACTLTSCYTNTMESIFAGSEAAISVCIVDEATQSMEAETLVPLMLGVQTLVLVGDNNQLPATVLSQKAKQLGLDQSLFGRIQTCFEGQENNPIILLDTQYRMSYPVAFWPNRYFYAGALRNAANLRNLPYNFYKVINLDSTQDIDKFSNTNEASFVANLVYTIMARSNLDDTHPLVKIGIITPYNNQKTLVTRKIKERIAMLTEKTKKKFVHEVNTVDSFQGQERDIIIMSCVRSNGIGFLSDRQRLCVALTRAKHTLILCGNFTAFQRNAMWNALLSDARGRGVYLNMRSSADVNEITRHIVR